MHPTVPGFALFTVAWLFATEASAQVVRQEVPGIRNFAKVESTVACAGAITQRNPGNREDGLRLDHQPPSRDRAGG